ncbi:MAG: four helix bundle protein, partial [Saprospiraceae bacterium]|nr:four helix bundle protein [Saprospiraceae bacterium]
KDQMYASGGSIMDNIAEGFERGNNREFSVFLAYAKGSAGEARSQLYRSFDFGYVPQERFDRLITKLKHISGKLHNMIQYLNATSIRGTRYKH